MVPDASLIIVVASAAIVFANSTASEFGAEEEAAFAASIALALGVSVSQVAEISTQELSFGDDDDISVSFAVFYETSADSELLLLEEVKSTLKEAVINGTFEGADVEASLRAIDEAVVVYLAPPTNRPSTSRPSARAHAGGTGTSSDNSAVVAIIVVTVSLAVLLGAVVFMLQATKHWLPWSCLKKNKSGTLAAPRDSNYDIRPAATNSFAAVEQEEEEDEIGLVAIVDEERRPPKAPHESYAMRARNRRIDWSTATVRFAATSERTYVRQFAVGSMTLTLARGPVGRLHPPESDSFQTTSEKLRHDLEHATTFDARVAAFQRETKRLHTPWQHGRVEFAVRRGSEAEDAYEKLKELEAADWRKRWFAGFAGEEALDAGGCSREFFHALSTQLFDVAFGLFKYGSGYSYQLADDAHSASVFPEDWEQWYEFVGRVVAKALLEGHVLPAHPSTILLKHMAGEPLKLDDLQTLDHDLWHSLDSLKRMTPEEIEGLELTFAVQQTVSAGASEKELVPGGTNKPVTSANLDQFIELRLKERVLDVCQRGLNACLEGLYSVLPLEVLMLLSAHELELTLCGIPELDVSKWKQSTNYRGAFEEAGADHQVVKWFWAVLEDWDHKKRASLLQWCTGTSALPVQGFGSLQGRDGEIRKFTLTSVALSQACYPRSHTCFNRIDLPLYKSKAELATALDFVLNPELATAFSMD
ncbi:hypothetical protein CTAYLR_001345 [Chrysophaeum taylorii]|uniref:HECT-type E3 ubiquitin transferase n=1 Tax=Chrysophaeum taylorii TaxID=2483200 RepID=A0AAD7U656_9STRA|nr:hypothetical protein CTAYLR_001345 [Chrysophaeum taylorii]